MAREFLSSPDLKAPLLLNGSAGTTGQVPISQGPSAPPAWGSAPGSGGGTPLVYAVGNWIVPFEGAFSAGTALIANQIGLYPFIVRRNVTVNNLGTRVTTAAAGSNLQLAIYGSDSNNKVTGAALGATGSLSGATVTAVSGAVTAFTMQAGQIYWMAVNSDGTPTALTFATSNTSFNSILGAPSLTETFSASTNALQLRTVPQTYGSWPDLTSITPTIVVSGNALKGALIAMQVSALP